MQAQIKVSMKQATAALAMFGGSLTDLRDLMRIIGAGQLVSIRRTFSESGVPSGSWVPLAASTMKRKKYTAGHKLLIGRGMLLNSINAQVNGNEVVIGTGLVYAAVHQLGSRDRGGAIGPQARIDGRSVKVKEHEYDYGRRASSRDVYEEIEITDKNGRKRKIKTRRLTGMSFGRAKVSEHQRFQNIPARPYLVFRPEDPERINTEAQRFLAFKAKQAGLEVKGESK